MASAGLAVRVSGTAQGAQLTLAHIGAVDTARQRNLDQPGSCRMPRTRRYSTFVLAVAPLLALVAVAPQLAAQRSGAGRPSTQKGEWPHYTGDLRGSRYSPLDQINASNFSKLEVAWRFKPDNLGPRPEYNLEGTPLMINGVLYTTAGTRRAVVALDAKTGELLWTHRIDEGRRAA